MPRKETIVNSAWTTDFLPLANLAKLLYVWSWTNLAASLSGIYEIQRRVIEFETGIEGDEFDAALAECQDAGRFHFDGAWAYVPARLDNINRQAPTVMKAVARDLQLVPPGHKFLAALIERYPDYIANLNRMPGVSIPSQNPDSKGKNETVSRPSFVQGQGQGSFKGKKGPRNLTRRSRGLDAAGIIAADYPHLQPMIGEYEAEAVLSAVQRLQMTTHELSTENVALRIARAGLDAA